uniref:Uncharacterized protein n=1 Tax=Gallid alphaherpesvirus 2 TaxID=10390 RepID=Q15A23_9ALPH|nr:hypothetical protein MDV078.2 [Gallid alphaherpesvirus 2]ABG22797.1 hypothetical protein MDV078.2 [Gallid alphaherpesvirus 2]
MRVMHNWRLRERLTRTSPARLRYIRPAHSSRMRTDVQIMADISVNKRTKVKKKNHEPLVFRSYDLIFMLCFIKTRNALQLPPVPAPTVLYVSPSRSLFHARHYRYNSGTHQTK